MQNSKRIMDPDKDWGTLSLTPGHDKVMNNRRDRLIFQNEDKKAQEFIYFLKTSKTKKLKELLESCQKHEWKDWVFEVEIRTGGYVTFNALHVAIVMQNMDVIDHFLSKEDMAYINAQVVYDNDQIIDDKFQDDNWIYGATALHLAARFYHHSLSKLIEVSNELIDNQDNAISFSPLHITAIAEHHLGSKILIKKGATVDALDKHKRTPLYFAAKSENYLDVVTLVEEGGARIYLKDNQHQPYRIAKSSDIMKFFFTKMTPSDLLEIDPQIQLYDEIVKNHPSLIEPFLNIFLTSTEKDLEASQNTLQYDLSLFCTGDKEDMKKFNRLHRHLQLIDTGNISMLLHPTMRVFSDMKWTQFYFNFLLNIFFVIAFLLCFSWYGYTYIDMTQCTPLDFNNSNETPLESTCAKGFKGGGLLSDFKTIICTKNDSIYSQALEKYGYNNVTLCDTGVLAKCRKKSWRSNAKKDSFEAITDCLEKSNHLHAYKNIRYGLQMLDIARYSTMVSLAFIFLIEVAQLVAKVMKNRLRSYLSLQNTIELLILFMTAAFLHYAPQDIEKAGHIGGWALFLAWMDFTAYLSQMSTFGRTIYSSIYVSKKVFKSLVIFLPSLIGFTSAFHFFLHGNDQFQSFFDSFLKVVIMMIGEYEFEDNFSFDETRSKGGRNGSIQVMFVLFIIYGSVIVMNLIVAIVVNRLDMDQAEALLQSHRIEDISEKTEPDQIKKIFSTILWFSNHSKVEPKGKHEEENGKVKPEPHLESIEGPIIEVKTEDKDSTYFLFSYTFFRNRLHAYMRKGKNLAVDFGREKVLTVEKEVVKSTLKTLRKKREDYLTMIRQIKRIQLHDTETIF